MGGKAPARNSRPCQHGDHESYSHKRGASISFNGRNRQPMALLCGCPCHGVCPVGRPREVPDQEWLDACTCPESRSLRDIEQRVHEMSDARRTRDAEVIQDIRLGRGRQAKDIQQEILASYRAHGYEPPSDFSRWSRFLAAGTARRGTRTIRLLAEAVSGFRAVRRWSPSLPDDQQPSTPASQPGRILSESAHNKSGLGRMGLTAAGCGFLAVAAAAAAYFNSGIFGAVLTVIAAFFAALAAWVTFWYIAIDTLIRISRN